MALLHAATITPSKDQILADWLPTQSWAETATGSFERVGAFRFDDPEGSVGIETHLVRAGDVMLQVPLTYRDAPLHGGEDHLVCTMEHSALGQRWVYDAVGDAAYVRMLAAATLTGHGQALGMVEHDGRWTVVPSPVRLFGGGWSAGPVPVDRYVMTSPDQDGWAVLGNDRFELRLARRPVPGDPPAIGLLASVPGVDEPLVLASIHEHGRT